MPSLARIVSAPLEVDIRPGAVAALPRLLADRRISSNGDIAFVVGPGVGDEVAAIIRGALPDALITTSHGATLDSATKLIETIRADGFHDAIVAIGGGQTIDLAKYAASMMGLPFVACATSLAHDGVASPVAVIEAQGRKVSFGVHVPIAVVVDLDYVRRSPVGHIRSGIGDTLSNLSAIEDWELAGRENGEYVDRLAVSLARGAATGILWRTDDMLSDPFLTGLAEALFLSGMAMAVAGSSRPCSGACHEISHAIDELFPGRDLHGSQVGVGTLFVTWLRGDPRFEQFNATFQRYGLARLPSDLDLTSEQFADAVAYAPSTRPGRYTLLEHLDLRRDDIGIKVGAFIDEIG